MKNSRYYGTGVACETTSVVEGRHRTRRDLGFVGPSSSPSMHSLCSPSYAATPIEERQNDLVVSPLPVFALAAVASEVPVKN